ncbi:MAG: hypothetical protein FWE25_03260 [Lachnospiraceae bacterium]|nr:hypothetical protein [Lachnospiraceae bacterium]
MYIEIRRNDSIVGRITSITNVGTLQNELNFIPCLEITVALREDIQPWDTALYFFSDKVFHGLITDIRPDYQAGTQGLTISHISTELEQRQIPTNRAIKLEPLDNLFENEEFIPAGWSVDNQTINNYIVDYVFSRETQATALSTLSEMTTRSHWRINPFIAGKNVEFGEFGRDSGYIFSAHRKNIEQGIFPIISITPSGTNFDTVRNVAVVYGQKSDSGMSSLTLRDVYLHPEYWIDGFPIEKIRDDVNNEREYEYDETLLEIAPNQNFEYRIRDDKSIEQEGRLLETTTSFNTISPFASMDEEVTNEDRIKASRVAYEATTHILRNARRYDRLPIETAYIPPDLNVGDRVWVEYDPAQELIGECDIERMAYKPYTGYKYVRQIRTTMTIDGRELSTIALDDEIRVNRDDAVLNDITNAIFMLNDKADANSRIIGSSQLQRRNGMNDLHGVEYTAYGSAGSPAYFNISISKDKIYFERFEFRVIIEGTRVPLSDSDEARELNVTVNNTSLSIVGNAIDPDPHGHSATGTRSAFVGGVTDLPPTATNFGISINGYDVTSIFTTLYPNGWLTGQGVFPSDNDTFDWQKIASNVPRAIAEEILRAGAKNIEISGDGTFRARYISFINHNHVNR